MPWLILFFAVLYFVTAWQGPQSLATLNGNLATDIPNYGKFVLMIAVIWAIGLVPAMRKPAMLLLALILVTIALSSSSGFFTNIQTLGTASQQPITNTAPSQVGGSTSSSSGILGTLGSIGSSIQQGSATLHDWLKSIVP